MRIYTKEEQFKMIEEHWVKLALIDNQYEEVCLEAIEQDGMALQYVKEQTEEMCLKAVRKSGFNLKDVKKQTPKICLEAVKENGYVLKYVKEQTEEICLEAVKQSFEALEYVKNQTVDLCLEAVKRNGYAINFIKEPTLEMYFYAFINDYKIINDEDIVYKIHKFIDTKPILKNNVFCANCYRINENNYCFFNIKSLRYLKDLLINKNIYNKYILPDKTDIELLKEIAISNNELILVDTGHIEFVHKKLANRIIKKEDLEKECFI